MSTRHGAVETMMGPMTIVATGEAITGLYFDRHARRPRSETFGPRIALSEDEVLTQAARQLMEYLEGTRRTFELTLDAAGDAFQQSVWAIVSDIPFGTTTTYGAIAAELGNPSLAQEVGQAVGMNPLCIFIPCHRVVGASGALTGYAGGLARKRTLLELEEPVSASAGRLF
jgi:methylated-DNA-[protein]-cysteine S-methyltransferase